MKGCLVAMFCLMCILIILIYRIGTMFHGTATLTIANQHNEPVDLILVEGTWSKLKTIENLKPGKKAEMELSTDWLHTEQYDVAVEFVSGRKMKGEIYEPFLAGDDSNFADLIITEANVKFVHVSDKLGL